jgi:branched-chain amino acid transport system permease protein
MIGVHGDTVRRAAWIISSMFAALVGILISPRQGLDVNELVLVVIYAFAPAVLGQLYGLPWAYAGGVILGVIGSILSKYSNSNTVANIEAAVPYIALLLLLVVTGRRLKEVGTTSRRLAVAHGSSSSSGGGGLGRRWVVGVAGVARWHLRIDRTLALGMAAFVAALFVPLAVPGPRLFDVTAIFMYGLIALTLVVLTGWAGQISLAQFSFVGVGAFTAGHLAGAHGEHFLYAALIGMLLAVPLGVVVGLVSLRLSGLYLALATLAFALIMDDIGRRLHILRDSPMAASTLGVNLTVTKVVVFVICGMVAALGGAFYGALQQAITPLDFMWSTSLTLLLLVVLGGRSLISGALIAGGTYAVQLIIPGSVEKYVPLLIALGVIALAQEPEGSIALSRRETRRVLTVLRPLPRWRPSPAAPSTNGHAPARVPVGVGAGDANGSGRGR